MPTDHPPDPELAAERVHLAASRAALARMRARTGALDAAAAGDWVSREFLESAFAERRGRSPTTPACRCSSAGSTTCPTARSAARASTSAVGTSPTRTATRWSSTGGRR